MTDTPIKRGEVWMIRFDPSEGDEIKKIRPAVCMSPSGVGRLQLRIVVPITAWQTQFGQFFWLTPLVPTLENGLSKHSAADAFQVKSISTRRFEYKLGVLLAEQIEEIAAAIVLCIGHKI